MVYSTAVGFRVIFLGIALFLFLTFTVYGGSIFKHTSIAGLTLFAICMLSSLFLERWVFDKNSNLFERNVGIVFLYWRKRILIDTLRKVVLDEFWRGVHAKTKMGSFISRRTVVLYLEDREGGKYKLNIVRGPGIAELRRTAEKISDFCGIPIEDNLSESSETSVEGNP